MAESVGRQGAAVREQFVFEAERAQVGDPHRIEDAVEVIHLVLDDARMEASTPAVYDAPSPGESRWASTLAKSCSSS